MTQVLYKLQLLAKLIWKLCVITIVIVCLIKSRIIADDVDVLKCGFTSKYTVSTMVKLLACFVTCVTTRPGLCCPILRTIFLCTVETIANDRKP